MIATIMKSRRLAVWAAMWALWVTVPDLWIRHEVLGRSGRSGPIFYIAISLGSLFLWLRFIAAVSSLRARVPWLGWVLLSLGSICLPVFAVGTLNYFFTFNLDPRPIVWAYILENPKYIVGIAYTGSGWLPRLGVFAGPLLTLAVSAWTTRVPMSIGKGWRWHVPTLAALLLMSFPFWSSPRLTRRPFPADLRGFSTVVLGTKLWVHGSDLPTLPTAKREPVVATKPADARDVFMIVHESLSRDQLAPWAADGEPGLKEFLGKHAEHTAWFPRATTVAPVTNVALPSLVSGLGPDAPRNEFARAPLLWHEAKARGYRTALLTAEDYDFAFFRGFMVADGAGLDTVKTAADYAKVDTAKAPRVNDRGVADSLVVDDALEIVRSTPADQRLFLVLQFNATHFPCWAPEMGNKESNLNSDTLDPKERRRRCVIAARYVISEAMRFLDGVEKSGRLERSLVIGTADHGETFAGERPLRPINYDENVLNVPLFVHLPADAPPENRKQLHANAEQRVSNLDIAPTVLESWGTPQGPMLRGTSLTRAVSSDRVHVSAAGCAIYEPSADGFAIHHKQWKWRISDFGGAEAFDLVDDPGERKNRINDLPKEERQIFWAEVDRRPPLARIVKTVASDLAR